MSDSMYLIFTKKKLMKNGILTLLLLGIFGSCGTSIYECQLKTVPEKFQRHVQLAADVARKRIAEHNQMVEKNTNSAFEKYDFEKSHIFIYPCNGPEVKRPYVLVGFENYEYSKVDRDDDIRSIYLRVYDDNWSVEE
ncbi:MAG: hypothetical protein JXR91_17745 [Deltaproteobacteria bacterium]|nr:hypothetical protein [Deltaproteobacteria bacterium]